MSGAQSFATESPISDSAHNLGWVGWGPREPEPTTLIALWPDGEAPTRTEVLAALAESGFKSPDDLHAAPTSDETLWTAVLRTADEAPPIILWAEPAQPMTPGELDDAAAEKCKWIVGFQSLLDANDPLPSLVNLLRCVNAGVGDAPAVLDVDARRWLPRAQLEQLLADDAPLPPCELLWTIEAVSKGEGSGDPGIKGSSESRNGAHVGGVWLRTQGLARCGRPELEMLEVPEANAPVAATLLNDVAELLLELPLPDPGQPLEVGVGLSITLQPVSEVVPFLAESAAGTAEDRAERGAGEETNGAAQEGDVAVVCASEPAGRFRKLWVWPQEVVVALAEEGAAVYKTTRTTERTAALAQYTWPELAMLWVRAQKAQQGEMSEEHESQGAIILIKVGFEVVSDEAPAREHLWFMVREIAGDKAQGQLINQPMHATSMEEGDTVWLNREGMSDWRLILPGGIVQPADMLLRSPGLERLVSQLEHSA